MIIIAVLILSTIYVISFADEKNIDNKSPTIDTITGDITGDVTGNVTGYIILPTSDPEVVGALWNDGGTITVSAG